MSRSIRSTWRVAAIVLALTLVAGACGKDDKKDNASDGGSSANAKEYSIAFVGPKTGDAANLGINILYGAKLAVKQFNASQSDVKITLKEFDTQGAAAQAPGQLALYKDDASILGIVGPAFSAETKAVIPESAKRISGIDDHRCIPFSMPGYGVPAQESGAPCSSVPALALRARPE